jgi:hypothetical protein
LLDFRTYGKNPDHFVGVCGEQEKLDKGISEKSCDQQLISADSGSQYLGDS